MNLDSDNHYMIDIETLDTRPSAHILAIACVRFTPSTGEVHEYREWYIGCEGQKERTRSGTTRMWWEKQLMKNQTGNIERIMYPSLEESTVLPMALRDLWYFLRNRSEEYFVDDNFYVWSKGIDFDLPILEHAYAQEYSDFGFGPLPAPWQYWAKCDVRTLYHVLGKPPENVRKPEKPHDPVSDCLAQIRGVHWCVSQIEALRNSCTNPDA